MVTYKIVEGLESETRERTEKILASMENQTKVIERVSKSERAWYEFDRFSRYADVIVFAGGIVAVVGFGIQCGIPPALVLFGAGLIYVGHLLGKVDAK